ncbi:hypothetical protein KIPE111705_42875 [Kibdelosporangium persicum]|uniref:DUF4190 domain-containing protein n=1 Tax=Kibdelosporangium persicum TaxID=2698649 RepID=A0ABX2F4Q0_9PSEU|nr:hypothetical protein [Kibdelosporangium persicum]NRN66323.1 hypothetical protein [Kibdelosporangium persicum]
MSAAIRPPEAATPIFRNGFATTALALGIVGVGFGLSVLFGLLATVSGTLAVLFGVIGVVRARRGRATDGGMAAIGVVAGLVAVALGVMSMVSIADQPTDSLSSIGLLG